MVFFFPLFYHISFQESVRAAFLPVEKLDKDVTLNLPQSGVLLSLLRKNYGAVRTSAKRCLGPSAITL